MGGGMGGVPSDLLLQSRTQLPALHQPAANRTPETRQSATEPERSHSADTHGRLRADTVTLNEPHETEKQSWRTSLLDRRFTIKRSNKGSEVVV